MSHKGSKKSFQRSPKRDRFGGAVGLLFVAFWGAFSTPRCCGSCPCCCLMWCSVFCMLEFWSFLCCCCCGFGSPWLLVLRACCWVFLRSAEQATNRLEPKRGRRQGRSRKIKNFKIIIIKVTNSQFPFSFFLLTKIVEKNDTVLH